MEVVHTRHYGQFLLHNTLLLLFPMLDLFFSWFAPRSNSVILWHLHQLPLCLPRLLPFFGLSCLDGMCCRRVWSIHICRSFASALGWRCLSFVPLDVKEAFKTYVEGGAQIMASLVTAGARAADVERILE